MPGNSDDTQMAASYPPVELYDDWCDHAEDLDLSRSKFIIEMVEAGRKKIELNEFAADSLRQLREERRDLQNEVERQRQRVRELERQMQRSARGDIVAFVEENPGATAPEIIQHVANTVPSRTVGHLDLLEGRTLANDDGEYYVLDEAESAAETNDADDDTEDSA